MINAADLLAGVDVNPDRHDHFRFARAAFPRSGFNGRFGRRFDALNAVQRARKLTPCDKAERAAMLSGLPMRLRLLARRQCQDEVATVGERPISRRSRSLSGGNPAKLASPFICAPPRSLDVIAIALPIAGSRSLVVSQFEIATHGWQRSM
jgi:hypothetical protein